MSPKNATLEKPQKNGQQWHIVLKGVGWEMGVLLEDLVVPTNLEFKLYASL